MKKNILIKNIVIQKVEDLISSYEIIAIIDFSGLTSLELKEIRKLFTVNKIFIKVVKNTLVKKALLNLNKNFLIKNINGQKLFLFCNDLPILMDSLNIIKNKNFNFKIKYIYLYNRLYNENNFNELNNISNKENILTKLTFTLKSPIIKFLESIKYPYIRLNFLLKTILKNKEK